MKILIINTDYPVFLKKLYFMFSNLDRKSYQEQLWIRNETEFGSSNFYSDSFHKIGHEAIDIHYNNISIQAKWAEENLKSRKMIWKIKKIQHQLSSNKLCDWLKSKISIQLNCNGLNFMEYILKHQIDVFKPDVILNQALVEVSGSLLKQIKNSNSQLLGQIASPLPSDEELKNYDMLISSLPNQVAKFTSLNIPSLHIKLAFDAGLLSKLPEVERDLDLVFVGSITSDHHGRVQLLEYLCRKTRIKIWGSIHGLDRSSPIYHCYQGEAFGMDMFKIFRRAKMVLNNHIDIAENYANNMRLYEATGCGALLLTDNKVNLDEIFKINEEVLAYSSFEECLEKIEYYLDHHEARMKIAALGQKRTLEEHSYINRMKELTASIGSTLKQ